MTTDTTDGREALSEALARAMAAASGYDPDQPCFHSFQAVPAEPEPAWKVFVTLAEKFIADHEMAKLRAAAHAIGEDSHGE